LALKKSSTKINEEMALPFTGCTHIKQVGALPFAGAEGIRPTQTEASDVEGTRKKIHYHELSAKLNPPIPLLGIRSAPGSVMKASYNVPSRFVNPRLDETKLTLRPKSKNNLEQPVEYKVFSKRQVAGMEYHTVPRFYGLAAFGEPTHNQCTLGTPIRVPFVGTLLEYQEHAVTKIVNTLTGSNTAMHGAMLEAACGCGKTVMAINTIARVGRKTAILVHKSFLVTQWRERIAEFLPDARVGICQGPTLEVGDDVDITIVMIQSVCRGKYAPNTFDTFGLLIVDECHHIAAKWFQSSLRYFAADKRLGLTATAQRADGLGFALHWYLGPTVFKIRRAYADVSVNMVQYTGGKKSEISIRGQPAFTQMVTRQVQDSARNAAIVRLAQELLDDGRRIIVMSARRDHLKTLYDGGLGERGASLYMGETSKKRKRERDENSKTTNCLLATYSMGEEGLDLPFLDAIILATPKSSLSCIEQSVGRILRAYPDKQSPLIVDFFDGFSVFWGMMRKRRKYYESRNYSITTRALK
jgi:superfamily II DNA or RNA helicase